MSLLRQSQSHRDWDAFIVNVKLSAGWINLIIIWGTLYLLAFGGGSWIIGSRLFIIPCFFLQIIHYSFHIFRDILYSFFVFFASIFLSDIFYTAILYIGYQKLTFQYTFNLIFSKHHSTFSVRVVKIMLSFSVNRPSIQLLEHEGPNDGSLISLSTKK